MPPETCEKHDDCLGRIHDKLNTMDKSSAYLAGELKAFMEGIKEFREEVKKDIYSKGGLMERAGTHARQLYMQWGLLVLILAGIVAVYLKK